MESRIWWNLEKRHCDLRSKTKETRLKLKLGSLELILMFICRESLRIQGIFCMNSPQRVAGEHSWRAGFWADETRHGELLLATAS
ncbi:hypothetical protein QL285_086045 [Trifolium repens]|nr:hypothetical protein QL285_086045 [Trifolium repens]